MFFTIFDMLKLPWRHARPTQVIPHALPLRGCPRCGRIPHLRAFFGKYNYAGFRFECRKWLGLRYCFGTHTVIVGLGDRPGDESTRSELIELGTRTAATVWDLAIDHHKK